MKILTVITAVSALGCAVSNLDAAPRKVLAENFTATWCTYCPNVAEGLILLQNEFPDSIFAIQIHCSDDYETTWGNQRQSFYQVGGYPTVWTDGILNQSGSWGSPEADYTKLREAYMERQSVPTDVTLEMCGESVDTDTYSVSVTVGIEAGGDGKDLRIHCAQVIHNYPSTPNYNYACFMQSLNADTSLKSSGSTTIDFVFDLDSTSMARLDDVSFIAWAQSTNNSGPSEVYQAEKHAYGSLSCVSGACCIGFDCSTSSEDNCIDSDGEYLGDETDCGDSPCNPPLVIDYPSGRPNMIDPYGGTSVQIHVTDGYTEPAPDSGTLHVKVSGMFWMEIPLVEGIDSEYVGTFPYMELDCGELIDWFISFDTLKGNVVESPSNAPDVTWSVYVYSGQESLFNDNFQSDLGWIPIVAAEDGNWVRGIPSGSGDACDPPSDADGSGRCFVTGNGANEDVDNGMTMLYSPTIPVDLSEAPVLSYYRWYSNGSNCGGANTHEDVMLVEISADGGSSFAPLEVVGPAGNDAEGGWRYVEFNLTEVLGDTGMVDLRLLFTCADDFAPSTIEGGVDSVKITNSYCDPPPACLAADIDSNGVVGVADLLAVIDQWGGSGNADVNGDGTVNVADLLAIVDAWGPC